MILIVFFIEIAFKNPDNKKDKTKCFSSCPESKISPLDKLSDYKTKM